MRFIFEDKFWFVHIKSNFHHLHISHQVAVLLCQLAVFAYNGSYRFLSLIAQPTIAISLCVVDFRFNIIGFYAAIKIDLFSLFRFHFLNHAQFFSLANPPVCLLKYPYSCFSSCFCFLVLILLPVLTSLSLEISIQLFFFLFLFPSSYFAACTYVATAATINLSLLFFMLSL